MQALRPAIAFCLLAVARLSGALLRILGTSPDETYGGLEPVHLLLYGSGELGWGYTAEAALRSMIHPSLHAAVLAPMAAVLGQPGGPAAWVAAWLPRRPRADSWGTRRQRCACYCCSSWS